MKLILICVISGFAAKYMRTAFFWVITQRVVEFFLPTFRDNLSVPSSGAKIPNKACCPNIPRSLPPTHLHQPYWLTPPLLRLSTAHTLPIETPYWNNRLTFGFTAEDGTDRLSRNVGKKLSLPAT
jgi:hypothetical protein